MGILFFFFLTENRVWGSNILKRQGFADREINRMKASHSNPKRRMTAVRFIMICLCLVLLVEGTLAESPGDSRTPTDREAELVRMPLFPESCS